MRLDLESEDILLTDNYKLIKNTTKTKNKEGNIKKYVSYNCSFPYLFIDLFDNPNLIYFYEYLGKTYITNIQPPSSYTSKKVALHCRKSSSQKSSRENKNKKWAQLVTVPKIIMGNVGNYNQLNYILHCNKKDFVNGKKGLLEVYLS